MDVLLQTNAHHKRASSARRERGARPDLLFVLGRVCKSEKLSGRVVAASGGDGLPWAFQELEAGPIVGENTMGILVGPATGHALIDGGGITVPGARLYDNDGHWFWEGEGVSPDIEVWDDPTILAQGRDPQIERLVDELLELLEDAPPRMTPAPAREDRLARDLR